MWVVRVLQGLCCVVLCCVVWSRVALCCTKSYALCSTGRLVLKETLFFCVGEYAGYGFDQQRLIWYVFCLWDMVFS